MKAKVITRYPPSPTGFVHIGSVRTALFNYLFAARSKGEMALRFEDTDRERSKAEYEKDILEGLHWLDIPYTMPDTPRQSERTDVYKKYIPALIAAGHAYEAEASQNNPDKKVVRFKNPNKTITFSDSIRGDVTFDTTDLGDFVIARTIDEPLYHLAVVIDDHAMGVTHVIRGEDHISNTPRQILILEALGFERPQYAHIPLILAPDRTKLSKRHGAVSVNEYRSRGFIPEAIVNYLALLGWNPGGEQEVFSRDELVELFDLGRVHKGGAVFDIEKLKWFNQEHLRRLSDEEFLQRLEAYMNVGPLLEYIPDIVPLLKERSKTLLDAMQALESGEYDFLEETIQYPRELLWQGAKADAITVKKHLEHTLTLLKDMREDFTGESVKNTVFPYATEQGRASVLWPMRIALSGREKSPDPFALCTLLGRGKCLERIEEALKML